jgi:hypothetical protein
VCDNLNSGANIVRTCFIVDNAKTGTTIGAALGCLFASDWGACMDVHRCRRCGAKAGRYRVPSRMGEFLEQTRCAPQ